MTRQRMSEESWVVLALLTMLTVVTLVALLAGCSGGTTATPSAPSTSACWNAMVAQYQHDVATGATGTFPPACRGVADSVIQFYAAQLMTGNTEAPTP